VITVATYRNLNEAEIGRIRLKGEGIEAFIADQATVTAGYGTVIGWIRLQVADSDAERAVAILSKAESAGLPDDVDPGTGTENGSHRGIPEELRRLSRTVQNCTIVVVVSLLLTCIYISFTFRQPYRADQKIPQPSWGQVQDSLDRLEYDKAIRQTQALIAKNPKDYYGHSWLVPLYVLIGDLTNAEKEARWAYELFPTEQHRDRLSAIERLQQQAATNTSQGKP
jgi:hypothetical protein